MQRSETFRLTKLNPLAHSRCIVSRQLFLTGDEGSLSNVSCQPTVDDGTEEVVEDVLVGRVSVISTAKPVGPRKMNEVAVARSRKVPDTIECV